MPSGTLVPIRSAEHLLLRHTVYNFLPQLSRYTCYNVLRKTIYFFKYNIESHCLLIILGNTFDSQDDLILFIRNFNSLWFPVC